MDSYKNYISGINKIVIVCKTKTHSILTEILVSQEMQNVNIKKLFITIHWHSKYDTVYIKFTLGIFFILSVCLYVVGHTF